MSYDSLRHGDRDPLLWKCARVCFMKRQASCQSSFNGCFNQMGSQRRRGRMTPLSPLRLPSKGWVEVSLLLLTKVKGGFHRSPALTSWAPSVLDFDAFTFGLRRKGFWLLEQGLEFKLWCCMVFFFSSFCLFCFEEGTYKQHQSRNSWWFLHISNLKIFWLSSSAPVE